MTAVRRATADDIPALLALWATSRTEHAMLDDRAEDVAAVIARSAVFVVDGDGDGDGGTLTGAIIAAWDGWRGWLYRLAVAPSARRQGLGLALVRAGEEWLIASGARRINVLVAFEDSRARGLWHAAGYTGDEVIGRMYRNL